MSSSEILELFGQPTRKSLDSEWPAVVAKQHCPFSGTKCFKVRKSQPEISIGTCSVRYGRDAKDIIICPLRLLERKQVFTDCLHLLTMHQPGNELHVVPEVSVPGGSVDYCLVSARDGKARDFAGIEFQTLDSTGTIWPERQEFLADQGILVSEADHGATKSFGMNWKMTAKTILVQLHHKVETFEHIGKHLVLVVQDCLLDYMGREFNFSHLEDAVIGQSMQFHAYEFAEKENGFRIQLAERKCTDSAGIATCLELQAEPRVELTDILELLGSKMSPSTLFAPTG